MPDLHYSLWNDAYFKKMSRDAAIVTTQKTGLFFVNRVRCRVRIGIRLPSDLSGDPWFRNRLRRDLFGDLWFWDPLHDHCMTTA